MAYQYMSKIFHDPHKNPPALPATYSMYGPLYVYTKTGDTCTVNVKT